MGNSPHTPFAALGSALRAMRQRAKESAAELSSAIEVTDDRLARFENGEIRPTEDVLELMIAHFALPDREADKLWDLAGYSRKTDIPAIDEQLMNQAAIMMLPIDARVVYTDMVHVVVNNYGVVLNFMQRNDATNQSVPVARVGMSREHAKSVLDVLQKTLHDAENPAHSTKLLQAPDADTQK